MQIRAAVLEEFANPLGIVPVVNLRNTDRIIGDWGSSEIDDLKPLVDALNKSLADMMVTSEYVGRPRRWATGIELTETPVLDADLTKTELIVGMKSGLPGWHDAFDAMHSGRVIKSVLLPSS